MIVQAKVRLFIPCPSCLKGSWRADQLSIGQVTSWCCDECHTQSQITRTDLNEFETIPTGKKETPVTVTLRSVTTPPITVKLNTWKYAHSQDDSPEDYIEHERYFYNEHTCPTNWTRQIEQIEFEGDRDPHGVFEFVSVEDGHFVDQNDMSFDARKARGEVV